MPKNSKGRDIAEIIPDKCIGCQLCLGECKLEAITMKNGVAHIDPEKCSGCGRCVDVCPANSILYEKVRKKKPAVAGQTAPSAGQNQGVAVFIETDHGHGAEVSWELVGKARELAAKLQTPVFGFLLGSGIEPVAHEAIAYGCDTVYMMDSPAFQVYISRVYGRGLTQLCQEIKPEILLLGASPLGRDLSSVVATRLETGLTADCTGLDIHPEERLLVMTRPAFGGNIMASILCRERRPQMSTVRPRVMKMPVRDPERQGEIKSVSFQTEADNLPNILEVIPRIAEGGVDITRAPSLVVLGKGACDSRQLPMLEELAHVLNGTIACSRAVIQAGLLPYARQVGQTGRTVAPKLYVGVGVSGAVQHIVGMQGSEHIIAINTDRNAPLVQIADYALIGDYLKVIPQFIDGIRMRAVSVNGQGQP